MTNPLPQSGEPPLLAWDTVWSETSGDWQMDGESLADDAQIATAIILQLFTDRRAPSSAATPDDRDDRRGWWGDFVDVRDDLFEQEMGSLIWLYERSPLNEDTRKGIEDAANNALRVLVDQGAVATYTVRAEIDFGNRQISLLVQAFGQSGDNLFDQRFNRAWAQVA